MMCALQFDHIQTTSFNLSCPTVSLIISPEALCFILFLTFMHMSTCMCV